MFHKFLVFDGITPELFSNFGKIDQDKGYLKKKIIGEHVWWNREAKEGKRFINFVCLMVNTRIFFSNFEK